jgi:hypothetical protein
VEKGGELGLCEGYRGKTLEVFGVHPGIDDFPREAFEGEVFEDSPNDSAVKEGPAFFIDLVALF